MCASASALAPMSPQRRASSAEDVRRAARRMVQEQLAKRSIARRAEHVALAEKDLITQAAARVMAHFNKGLQLDPPREGEGGLGALLQKRAKKVARSFKSGGSFVRHVELMTMQEMAAAMKSPSRGGAERVSGACHSLLQRLRVAHDARRSTWFAA
jgi:hypothetical protein